MAPMRTITAPELKKILADHKTWRESGGSSGARADLAGAYLAGANLTGAKIHEGASLPAGWVRGDSGIITRKP